MAVVPSDLAHYAATTKATSFSTSDVGGAIDTGTEITNGSLNEIFFTMEAAASGGGDTIQYGKSFIRNDNSTDQIDSFGIWLPNAIDDLSTAGLIELTSTSASDGSSKKARLIGFDNSGNPQQEEVTLNGTSTVTSSLSFRYELRVEIRLSSGSALTAAAGDITIEHDSSTVGVIPATVKTATNEIDIGLQATLGGSTTITDASTAPSSVTFSRPRVVGSKLTVDGGTGTLEATEAQAIWWRWTVPETMNPSSEVHFFLQGRGSAA